MSERIFGKWLPMTRRWVEIVEKRSSIAFQKRGSIRCFEKPKTTIVFGVSALPRISTKKIQSQRLPIVRDGLQQPEAGGWKTGMRVGLLSSYRATGAEGPRSSMKMNKTNCSNSSKMASLGNHRRFSTFFTKNSVSNTTRTFVFS